MAGPLTVVLDVGKTFSKLTLWDAAGGLLDRLSYKNRRVEKSGYVGLDAAGIENWLRRSLTALAAHGPIGAIIPVGHGAAAAIIRDNKLALLPLDYEEPVGETARAAYDAQRDSFALTGSPALPNGLNLGAQLDRLERLHPHLFDGWSLILPWAQYWAWVLSGVAASEVTSLGCHTDLWSPLEGRPSALAMKRGWAKMLAPLRHAGEALGPIRPQWSVHTGIPSDAQIYCGLHDSNAALLAARGFPEIADEEATVLSTGTWFIGMRSPGKGAVPDIAALPEGRDCLVNVDAFGTPIPSARFMGGREIEVLGGFDLRRVGDGPHQGTLVAAVPKVLRTGSMILPTMTPGVGPFPHMQGEWVNAPDDEDMRCAAACLYAALVADASLDLIGTSGRILVEGRFAEAEVFVRALASLRPGCRVYTGNMHNDVSYGARRLIDPNLKPTGALSVAAPLDVDLSAYRGQWCARFEDAEARV